jgi:hypothetical protein
MKKNLIAASVFVLGLFLGGASAYASSANAGGSSPQQITPEMAACISACQAAGGTRSACWACCVQNICPVEDL